MLVVAVAVAPAPGEAGDVAGPASSPARVVPGYSFEFPRDHFGHPEFESEWWYYTGNLFTASGRHFGFELTFFRRASAIDVRGTVGLGPRSGVSRTFHDHRHGRRDGSSSMNA